MAKKELMNINSYINKINIKNPMHLILVGFVLLGVVLLKDVLIVLAIGLFILAVVFVYKKRKEEEVKVGLEKNGKTK